MPDNKFLKKRALDELFRNSYRIIDANINRGKEGLRVCEEISRFHLENKNITRQFAQLRHKLTFTIKRSRLNQKLLFQERDTKGDIGKTSCRGPLRGSFKQIFMANAQRVKEALRVLEEFLKLFDISTSKKIQKLRFDAYTLEKKTIERFPALLDSR